MEDHPHHRYISQIDSSKEVMITHQKLLQVMQQFVVVVIGFSYIEM